MDIRLDGRSAVITGGSKGLGLAMAKQMAASGADVSTQRFVDMPNVTFLARVPAQHHDPRFPTRLRTTVGRPYVRSRTSKAIPRVLLVGTLGTTRPLRTCAEL